MRKTRVQNGKDYFWKGRKEKNGKKSRREQNKERENVKGVLENFGI